MRFTLARRAALLACLQTAPLVTLTPPTAFAAVELSEEANLVVSSWVVVQRAFYDENYNGVDWKAVRSEYVKRPYKSMKDARSAVSEMLSKLGDKYTRYLNPSAYATLLARFEAKGTDGGIGVVLRERSAGIVEIVSVADGSPASSAGLRTADVIAGVGGRKLPKGATAEDAAALILGPLDEPLSLSVTRGAIDSEPLEFALKRQPISLGECTSQVVQREGSSTIGVLTVPQFSDGQPWFDSYSKALTAIAKADALLIDLRGNPGGHFPTGVAASKLFLPSDTLIVSTRDRNGVSNPLYTTAAGPYSGDAKPPPLYLLVDRGTASAAEVFAAALSENGVATIIGEGDSTFGKGLVQTIAKVSDGGAVVCTTARYLTPKGNDLNGVGVGIDRKVAQPCARTPAGAVACLEASGALSAKT